MTRVALFSDLHLEFGPFPRPKLAADVVVLAGDTHTKRRAWTGEDAAAFFGAPVLGCAGNHEFYHGAIDTGFAKTKAAAAAKGIVLLEQEAAIVAGVRFLVCTLWSDFRLFAGDDLAGVKGDATLCVGDRYSGGINDFRSIRVARDGYRRFRPLDAARLHETSVRWLDGRLAEPFAGPTVVVTHHAPSPRCVPDSLLTDRRMAAYASDLEWLIRKHQPAVWCYGHIHESVPPFRIGGTLLASNPRGYHPKHLNPRFRPDLVLEV